MSTDAGRDALSIVNDETTLKAGPGWAVLWACFLGCSWTWVIGMFFPVLLLRDYGLWGWVAFAAPNVIGAAAMGFVLTPGSAKRLWDKHAGAVRWFSDVTLAFHVFVLMWLGTELFGPIAWAACAVPLLILPESRRKAWGPWLPTVALGVALVSWGCFGFFESGLDAEYGLVILDADVTQWDSIDHEMADAGMAIIRPQPRLPLLDLLIFIPASVSGFLCCPYLDGTFLRARAKTGPNTGRFAFAFGFGVVFFSMIVFSVIYADLLEPAFEGKPVVLTGTLPILLGIHILTQAAFTMTLHLREREALNHQGRHGFGIVVTLVAAFILVLLTRQPDWFGSGVFGVAWPEVGYRSFLLMYGLVFPAYVWLVVLSRRPVNKAMLMRFFVTILLAVPMGFVGFVTGPSGWLLGSLGVITLAKLVPVGRFNAEDAESLSCRQRGNPD